MFELVLVLIPKKMLSLPSMKGHDSNELQIREPFTFEFLGLKAKEVVTEQDIEDALITHLQEFILELGKASALSLAKSE